MESFTNYSSTAVSNRATYGTDTNSPTPAYPLRSDRPVKNKLGKPPSKSKCRKSSDPCHLLLASEKIGSLIMYHQQPWSAGALNAGEPIEKPETHCAGDIEDHLADLDLEFAICSRCCHCLSLPLVRTKKSDPRRWVSWHTGICVLLKVPRSGAEKQTLPWIRMQNCSTL